eukprot:CAMPEP_0168599362 /NCGR_PEP_ID=MMETSP0420-20121227/12019_1 /TAXON_ID=498008 /ORGANISM="Pessonella sp." /LENGTH=270 /DNA_ID=CAMNT_0008636999 /DNA_START=211 /DNA_END=1023 /DNA_ORIENTATION=+
MRDLVAIILDSYDSILMSSASLNQLLTAITHYAEKNKHSLDLEHLTKRNPFISIKKDATLFELAELLTKLRATRVRRVAVVDENDKVVKVLSQSTLLQAIVSQLNIVDAQQDHARFAELARTVEAAGVGTYPAVTVDEQTSAFDAFSLLEAKKLGGVGVLNATGTLVGNISIQDFKLFIKNPDIRLGALKQPVGSFLRSLREEEIDTRMPLIQCQLSSTLREVVLKLVGARVHRLYVVKSDQAWLPLGVLSLSDVLQALFSDALAEKTKQ